jgi:hypothetical protein
MEYITLWLSASTAVNTDVTIVISTVQDRTGQRGSDVERCCKRPPSTHHCTRLLPSLHFITTTDARYLLPSRHLPHSLQPTTPHSLPTTPHHTLHTHSLGYSHQNAPQHRPPRPLRRPQRRNPNPGCPNRHNRLPLLHGHASLLLHGTYREPLRSLAATTKAAHGLEAKLTYACARRTDIRRARRAASRRVGSTCVIGRLR